MHTHREHLAHPLHVLALALMLMASVAGADLHPVESSVAATLVPSKHHAALVMES